MGLMKEAFRRVRLMFAETKTNEAPFIRQSLKKTLNKFYVSVFQFLSQQDYRHH